MIYFILGSSPTINELLKNDHKLNSKACVRIEIIAPRRSTRKSLPSGSTSQASSPVADERFEKNYYSIGRV